MKKNSQTSRLVKEESGWTNEAGRIIIARPSLNFEAGWKFYLALVAAGTLYYLQRRYQGIEERYILAGLILAGGGVLLSLLSVFFDSGLFRLLSMPLVIYLMYLLIHFMGKIVQPLFHRMGTEIPQDLPFILPMFLR